jgi:hypothetical protein
MERLGKAPKNHMKDNRSAIRALEQRNREEEEEQNKAQKDLYKLSQFRNVESRVYDNINNQENNDIDGEEKHFLTKGSSASRRRELEDEARRKREEVERKLKEARAMTNVSERDLPRRKSSVPKADEVLNLAPRNNENFIAHNKIKAQLLKPPTHNEQDTSKKHEEYGQVPQYLQERNARIAEYEENKRRNAPDPNCPKGMCRMPEDERLSTLDTLHASRSECMHQLEKLPFVIETPSMRKRADALESKLREIEKAISIFSKPVVYVAQGS